MDDDEKRMLFNEINILREIVSHKKQDLSARDHDMNFFLIGLPD